MTIKVSNSLKALPPLTKLEIRLKRCEYHHGQYTNPQPMNGMTASQVKQRALDYFIALDNRFIPKYRGILVHKNRSGQLIVEPIDWQDPHQKRQIAIFLLHLSYAGVSRGYKRTYIFIETELIHHLRLQGNLGCSVPSKTVFKPAYFNNGGQRQIKSVIVNQGLPAQTTLMLFTIKDPSLPKGTAKQPKLAGHHMADLWDNRSIMRNPAISAGANHHSSHNTQVLIENYSDLKNFITYLKYTSKYYCIVSRMAANGSIPIKGFLKPFININPFISE